MDSQLSQYYRKSKEVKGGVTFQAFQWDDTNEKSLFTRDIDTGVFTSKDSIKVSDSYVVRCYGVSEKGTSVSLSIEKFEPYFYVAPCDDEASEENFKEVTFNLKNKLKKVKHPRIYDGNFYNFSECFLKMRSEYKELVNFYGFSNGKKIGVYKLVFNNTDAMTKAIRILSNAGRNERFKEKYYTIFNKKYKVFETKVTPLIRFMHTLEISPCSWLNVKKRFLREAEPDKFSCQMNYVTTWENIRLVEKDLVAPFLQASFDIEVHSTVPDPNNDKRRLFPKPETPGNYVAQIATSFKKYGEQNFFLNHIFVLGKCSPISEDPTVVITECTTETELLLGWKTMIKNMDPDIFYHWNGDKFDWRYLYKRAEVVGCLKEFSKLGRTEEECPLKHESFESSAYGYNEYDRIYPPGRVNFDVMVNIKREQKLESYKLDSVAEEFLGENKHPVSPQEMFETFDSGDPDRMKTVAHYCIQDTKLPQRLMDKLSILPNQIEMANVTFVPIQWLPVRGQSIKVFSQIVKRTMKEGFVIPTLNLEEDHGKFKGATVLKATPGAYWDPVVTLDFASLYPSIMRAHNFCYSTFIDPNDPEHAKYLDTPGVEYHTIKWTEKVSKLDENGEEIKPPKIRKRKKAGDDKPVGDDTENDDDDVLEADPDDNINKYGEEEVNIEDAATTLLPGEEDYFELKHYEYKFAKWKLDKDGNRTGEKVKSILPGLLSDLAIWRKNAKKLMAAEKDEFKRSVYNGRQLALKVSMNSVYGFLAAYTLRCRPIAACVTTTGRQMIETTKNFVENEFTDWARKNGYTNLGTEVIYGDTDSVFIKFQTGKKGRAALEDSWKLAKIAGEMITENCFEPPNDLEFEKAYFPLLQFKKKHYMGKMYEFNDKKPDEIPEKFKIDKKGVILKRRDNVPIARKIFKDCSDVILDEGEDGIDKAKGIFRKEISSVLTGEADFSDFTLSKEMKHNYAKTSRCDKHPTKLFRKSKCEFDHNKTQLLNQKCKPDCKKANCKECIELKACGKIIENCHECSVSVPHFVLAQRIKERSPGDAPAEGDRIPYVFVDIGNMTAKQFERVENPQYAKENGLKLDLFYYWEHQIRKPMSRLFGLLDKNPDGICADLIKTHVEKALQKDYNQKVPKVFRDYLAVEEQEKKKKHDRAKMALERKRQKFINEHGDNQTTMEMFMKSLEKPEKKKRKKKEEDDEKEFGMVVKKKRSRKMPEKEAAVLDAVNKKFKINEKDKQTII